ncbi:MAG: xylulokinase [Clostridiaceae bacterium]|nr:xylulokinase [Clostridiaceae bacterium]
MKYFLAHDLGTSGLKSSLFSSEGQLIKSVLQEYQADIQGREATQNPLILLHAVIKGSRQLANVVNNQDILAMSFSAQMNACLLVDENGDPLHDTLIWADTRAEEQADQLIDKLGFDRIYKITGNRASANYSLYKLMWLRDHKPEIYKKAYKMLQAKDYVSFKLTGNMVTDHSDASGTGAYDINQGIWSDEIINAANVEKDLFPDIINSIEPVGKLLPEMAEQMNLSGDTLVVAGGGDGPCATVGAGCIGNDEFYLTYGTSAWIGGTTDEPVFDPNYALFCFSHIIPNKFMPLGTMQAAGTSYKYLKDLFEDFELSAKDYDQLANEVPIGSDGLVYLPYLIGERSPIWDPKASAAFIGIRHHHDKSYYARAVLEGIAYNLEWILQSFRQTKDIKEMVITGGGAISPILRQIFADILNVDFIVPQNIQESTSIAAAIMAGIGSGYYSDFSVLEKFLIMKDKTKANLENVEKYQNYIPIFQKSYLNLKDVMTDLDNLR